MSTTPPPPGPGEPRAGVPLGIPGLTDAVEIGRGGFGVVYRAHQPTLHRTVAVKVVSGGVLDDRGRDRFERELHAMGTLSGHPNIVTIYDSGFTDDGRPFIVMDHMAGGSVADRLARGPLPWQEAATIGVKVAAALETAHRAGVLHRDIKPENVLISSYGDAKLADFGIARVQGGPETRTGMVTASMSHASPEILSGARPSIASDVYALGSTLFTMLSGGPAFFRDTDESLVPMITRIAVEPVPDLRARGVPDDLCRVVEQAMAKDPAQRFPSAAALGRALQEVQRRAGLAPTELHVASDAPDATAVASRTTATLTPPAPVPGWAPPPPPMPPPSPAPPAVPPLPPMPVPTPAAGPALPPPPPTWTTGPAAQPPTPPPSRRRGKVLAAVAALLVAIGVVVAVVLVSGGGDDDGGAAATTRSATRRTIDTRSATTEARTTTSLEDTTIATSPTVTGDTLSPDAISVFSLFKELCFDDPSGGTGTISVVFQRDCNSPHDAEVYDFYDFPNPLGDPYPGDDAVRAASNTECRNRFVAYAGTEVDDSPYTLFWLSPNEESWTTSGDREVACYVRDANSETGAKLTAPIVP